MKTFTPRRRYQAISITGKWCALKCRYCSGRYLNGMIQANPENFVEVVELLWKNGTRGILVSGGFDSEGKLPIEPYVEKLYEIKKKTGIFVSAHLGLIKDEQLLEKLASAVDIVDYEYLWNEHMINYVKNLPYSHEVYDQVLELMIEAGLKVAPHIYAWHPWITQEELKKELEHFNNIGVSRVVLLIYVPVKNEELNVKIDDVLRYIKYIRNTFYGDVYMGCMRPWIIKKELDKVLIEEEIVDRIVNPHPPALVNSYNIEKYDACCTVPDELIHIFKL